MADEKMFAVQIRSQSAGAPTDLFIGQVPRPLLRPGQVLVRVTATAVNRADCLQRIGKYPPPPGESDIMGLEFSGVIVELGEGIQHFQVGNRVCGLLGGGGYAEFVAVNEGVLIPIPENISNEIAAGFPEAFLTAFQALFWIGGLSKDREANRNTSVLIHAGASGVGTAAIQLCHYAGVGKIFTTAGTANKLQLTSSLGATVSINYKEEDFSFRVQEHTGGKGVDLVIDFVGQSYWKKNLDSLALDGKMVILGFLSGTNLPNGDIAPILRKRLTITGSTLRSRSQEYKAALTRDLSTFTLDAWSRGDLRVIIYKELSINEVGEAHRIMEADENLGKIVLKMP